jgi:hypothetical protein
MKTIDINLAQEQAAAAGGLACPTAPTPQAPAALDTVPQYGV